MSSCGCVSAIQAWAILHRHAQEEIGPLRLQELCRDKDRVSSLVAVHNSTFATAPSTGNNSDGQANGGSISRMLLVDLSRQRMTANTLNHLLQLASARQLKKFITLLSWGGQNDPNDPVVPLRFTIPPFNNRTNNYKTARFEADKERAPFKQNHRKSLTTVAVQPNAENDTDDKNDFTEAASLSRPSSMHMALRVPEERGYEMLLQDGTNALDGIHREWNRLERLSTLIRNGSIRGITGNIIQTCLVIGTGVPMQALKFVYQALLHDERAVLASRAGLETLRLRPRNILLTAAAAATGNPALSLQTPPCRRILFLMTLDPLMVAKVCQDLDASSTIVISYAFKGKEETGLATSMVKQWLLQELGGGNNANSGASGTGTGGGGTLGASLGSGGSSSNLGSSALSSASNHNRRPDFILSKHMIFVTGNQTIASVINKPESVHLIPQTCRTEAFTTFTAATLLPISICFGWNIAKEFLAGAHDVDLHLVNANPRHNLPILLALTDIWNDILLPTSNAGRIITPFSHAFSAYPAFCAALESQVCGNTASHQLQNEILANNQHNRYYYNYGGRGVGCSSLVVDGGFASSAYERLLYQSDFSIINSELVLSLDPQLHFNVLRKMHTPSENINYNSPLVNAIHSTQDALVCSMFAHADELAFGGVTDSPGNKKPEHSSAAPSVFSSGVSPPVVDLEHTSRGNRTSTLLVCNQLDAFSCGQFIALAEHRAAIKAHLWGHAFLWHDNKAAFGHSLRQTRTNQLNDGLSNFFHVLRSTKNEDANEDAEGEDEEGEELVLGGNMNLSTKTILHHYAKLTMENRGNRGTNT